MRTEAFENLDKYLYSPYKEIYQIGVATGLRISDIITLKYNQLDIEKPTIKEQKTGKPKRIYIPRAIRKKLKQKQGRKKGDSFVFASRSKTGHITRQAVWKAFKIAAERAKADCNVGTHTMRKNYAIRQLNKHKGLKYVQSHLNHEHLADTPLYLIKED